MPGVSGQHEIDQTRAATPASLRAPGVVRRHIRARCRAWAVLACVMVGAWLGGWAPASGLPWVSGWASSVWFGAAVGSALIGAVLPARLWRYGALGAVLLAMAGWATLRGHEPAGDRMDRVVAGGSIVTVIGVVRGAPERVLPATGPGAPGAWRDEQARFEMNVRTVRGSARGSDSGSSVVTGVSGTVGVTGPVVLMDRVRAGDACEVSGVYRVPGGARNPGEPDWRLLGNQRGHAGWIAVPADGLVVTRGTAGRGPVAGLLGGIVRARDWARGRAREAIGGPDAGVLGALVLGERDASFDQTYRVFQRAGVAHVLAVSGFHLALLGGLVAVLVRATGERGRLEALAVVAVVVVMLFVVPARAPIVRAGVLVIALLLGDAAGRRPDRLAVLAWAAVGLLVWRPGDASGLGFLLSVGVTATLLGLAERDGAARWSLFERGGLGMGEADGGGWRARGRWCWWWFRDAMRVNLACWAIATPTIVAATGVCSVIAPVASLVVVPLAAVVLVAGWAQAVLGVIWTGGAAHTVGALVGLSQAVVWVAGWLDGMAWAWFTVAGVGWGWCGVTTAAVAAWLFVPGRRRLAGVVIAGCVAWASVADARSGRVAGMRADMLDVGDGSAVLIRSGREAMLWDCGGLHRPVGGTVADAARALGVTRVRTAVVTHANLDHFNGLPEAAERLGIRTVLVSPALLASREGSWGGVRALLEGRGVVIRAVSAGDTIGLGHAAGRVLWAGDGAGERWLGNDGSIVVRFEIQTLGGSEGGIRSLLMCGDLQGAGVAGLLASGLDVRADVMEAPHHGSANASGVELAAAVSPGVVLQSTGPSRVGLEIWAGVRSRSEWLVTAERGAVFAVFHPDGSIGTGGLIDPGGLD